ncbi:MAG: hypothetical protein R3D25_10590 [Geminicoccaceae bacterium]
MNKLMAAALALLVGLGAADALAQKGGGSGTPRKIQQQTLQQNQQRNRTMQEQGAGQAAEDPELLRKRQRQMIEQQTKTMGGTATN